MSGAYHCIRVAASLCNYTTKSVHFRYDIIDNIYQEIEEKSCNPVEHSDFVRRWGGVRNHLELLKKSANTSPNTALQLSKVERHTRPSGRELHVPLKWCC